MQCLHSKYTQNYTKRRQIALDKDQCQNTKLPEKMPNSVKKGPMPKRPVCREWGGWYYTLS